MFVLAQERVQRAGQQIPARQKSIDGHKETVEQLGNSVRQQLSKDHLESERLFRWLTAIGVIVGIAGTYFLAFLPGVSQ